MLPEQENVCDGEGKRKIVDAEIRHVELSNTDTEETTFESTIWRDLAYNVEFLRVIDEKLSKLVSEGVWGSESRNFKEEKHKRMRCVQ